jgi:hypothetical protein
MKVNGKILVKLHIILPCFVYLKQGNIVYNSLLIILFTVCFSTLESGSVRAGLLTIDS